MGHGLGTWAGVGDGGRSSGDRRGDPGAGAPGCSLKLAGALQGLQEREEAAHRPEQGGEGQMVPGGGGGLTPRCCERRPRSPTGLCGGL